MSDALVQRSRRLARSQMTAHPPSAGLDNAIDTLREGHAFADVAARHGLPDATVEGVRSVYDFLRVAAPAHLLGAPCAGTACTFPVLDRLADCPEYKLTPVQVTPVMAARAPAACTGGARWGQGLRRDVMFPWDPANGSYRHPHSPRSYPG